MSDKTTQSNLNTPYITGEWNVVQSGVLGVLYTSTEAFYARFGLKPTYYQAIARVLEEVGEVNMALAQGEPVVRIAEEIGDAFVTLIGAGLSAGLTLPDIIGGMVAVAAKNDAKTLEHYYLREKDNKIARREPTS